MIYFAKGHKFCPLQLILFKLDTIWSSTTSVKSHVLFEVLVTNINVTWGALVAALNQTLSMSTTQCNKFTHIYHSIQVRSISPNLTEIQLSGVPLLKMVQIEVQREEVILYLWRDFQAQRTIFTELWAFEVQWKILKKSKIFPETDIAWISSES